MKYEHLVQMFNQQALGLNISRAQLWQGLVLRAEDPQRFDENISAVHILERSEDTLRREVQFGALVVREQVRFTELQAVHYHTEPSDQHIGGQMSMCIEEPQPGELFLRFCYINDLPEKPDVSDSNDPSYYVPYLKSAYHQADMHTAKRILELAVQGVLGSH
ncbi:AtaL-like protein [Vogesella facilis]|uniref:AtaL-like protein n=1 Tax=Vogesella facilis TaxID=1655232 RepID=A0ABV7RCY6_9NEIS